MGKSNDQIESYTWMWAFVIFIFIFIVSTIVVVVVATEETSDKLPKYIDAVVIERDPSVAINNRLSTLNVRLVHRHMPFIHNIYILLDSTNSTILNGSAERVTGVKNSYYVNVDIGTAALNEDILDTFFLKMASIKNLSSVDVSVPDISSHAIFLSDRTVPMRRIYRSDLFSREHPRMFNVFRDEAVQKRIGTLSIETIDYFEYTPPTYPTLISTIDSKYVTEAGGPTEKVNKVLFLSITQESSQVRNDFNRDVLLFGDNGLMADNHLSQISELDRHTPMFATFHLSGVQSIGMTFMKEYLVCLVNNGENCKAVI
jgi:hypothetical protein